MLRKETLDLHKNHQGKIAVVSKVPVKNSKDLSLAYTPGVAEPCREIVKDRSLIDIYTNRQNMVAVVSNGTAVLGLGDIGAYASMPVMEGKAVLFKSFAGVDAFPICLDTKDTKTIIETVKLMQPTFGGINLEDIAAPQCFEIEQALINEMDIPVFHDDQHGTAIVVMAALINGLKLLGKPFDGIKVVTNGAGSAGIAIINLLISMGVKNIIMCDRHGSIYSGRKEGMNPYKEKIAKQTNHEKKACSLKEALEGADVFIGVSTANCVDYHMVKSMAKDPIIFAMSNPDPEILPDIAFSAGAKIVGTGRSDYPNQVNNVAAFPGIFRGALDCGATVINQEMKIAAAYAIAGLISDKELDFDYITPKAFDERLVPAVAKAVVKAAIDTGVAKRNITPPEIDERLKKLLD